MAGSLNCACCMNWELKEAGARVSEDSSAFLGHAVDMIKDGQINNCLVALGALEAEYERLMSKMDSSAAFLAKASEVIKGVQREARVIQGPLSSDQSNAWAKRIASNAALMVEIAGSGAALVSSVMIPGSAVIYLGTAATGAILTGVTYQFSNHYAALEEAAKNATNLMSRLADITYDIDARLATHRQVVSLLIEDGRILIDNIKKAEMRFQEVRRHPSFADFEVHMLTEGTARVQAATTKMAERYRAAMESIYKRTAKRLELPTTAATNAEPARIS